MTFTPSLGQFVYGNPWLHLECPERVENVLGEIRDRMNETRIGCDDCIEDYTPFDNSGCSYTNATFHVEAYDWGAADTCTDDPATCQGHNFRFVLSSGKKVKVSWYKWLGRGTSINCVLTDAELDEMRTACLESLKGA